MTIIVCCHHAKINNQQLDFHYQSIPNDNYVVITQKN